MWAFVKSFATYRTIRMAAVISSALTLDSLSAENSTVTVVGTEIGQSDAGNWLVIDGGVYSSFKCHTSTAEGLTTIETDAFDGKCDAYIEGYRFIPAGQTWTRADGVVFTGEMIAPWKPWAELDAVQREYEREQYQTVVAQNAEYESALTEIETALGVDNS